MNHDQALSVLADLVTATQKAGADAVEAAFVDQTSLSIGWRLGTLEHLERSEACDIGLRVLVGKRQALVSSSDHSPAALAELVDRAVAMARVVPEDPFLGLADAGQLATDFPELDLFDDYEPDTQTLIGLASRGEDAARAVSGVSNSDGARASWARSYVAFVGSNGFSHAHSSSHSALSVSVLAGQDKDGMETDYDHTSAVYFSDLRGPEEVGREAGERTVKRLGARKVDSGRVPLVFDPRVSRGLVGSLAGAINGSAIARGTSFLKDSMGRQVFAPGIRIVDQPHRQRGLRSRPYDAEGLPTRPWNLIEDGKLTTWILDLRSARQLGLSSTGHASRGVGSPPAPSASNVYLEAGKQTPAELMADIKQGLYITHMFGSGGNMITGDYSRGAGGFWIENGQITFPVAEVTVAGNLKDMFLNLTPANDLELIHGLDAPTVRVEGMTLAGK